MIGAFRRGRTAIIALILASGGFSAMAMPNPLWRGAEKILVTCEARMADAEMRERLCVTAPDIVGPLLSEAFRLPWEQAGARAISPNAIQAEIVFGPLKAIGDVTRAAVVVRVGRDRRPAIQPLSPQVVDPDDAASVAEGLTAALAAAVPLRAEAPTAPAIGPPGNR